MYFQPGDREWVNLDHKHFEGHHHTLLPIRHGPYTILQKMAENAQHLDIPPQQGIHNVLNEHHPKLFEPPLLEVPVTISHQGYNTQNFQLHFSKDTLLDTRTHSTRQRAYTSYMVAQQGQTPAQAQWMTAEVMHRMFPHILIQLGTLPDLNKEELGQVIHLGEPPPRAHNSAN